MGDCTRPDAGGIVGVTRFNGGGMGIGAVGEVGRVTFCTICGVTGGFGAGLANTGLDGSTPLR